jgi:long-chain fatty acid transport protein
MARLASNRRTRSLSLLLCAALLAPAAARANGFALDIQGVFSNGTASAGAASTHDVAGMFANPAVIGHLNGLNLVVGGQYIAGKAPYTDKGSTVLTGVDLGTGPMTTPVEGSNGDGAKAGAAPWLFASYRVSPELAVGFSAYAPFGLKTDYGRSSKFFGRYQGVESDVESIAFGPTIAWRPIPQVSIGVSAAARRDSVTIGNAIDLSSACLNATHDPAACAPAYVTPGAAASDGYLRYTANGWGWTGTLGVLVEPVQGTLLGAAYRHESTSKVKGHEVFDGAAKDFFVGVAGKTINGDPGASVKLPLPDFMTLSLEQKIGKSFDLLAAVQVTFWNRFYKVTLTPDDPANGIGELYQVQGFRNAIRVSGGGVWHACPGADLFAGVAFEQSPVTTKYRQATLPERDTVIAGVGFDAKVWRNLTVGAVYQRVQAVGTSQIDYTDDNLQRVYGSVKSSANVLAAQIGWKG